MLTILHELGRHMDDDGTINLQSFKIVYVAPMKVGEGLVWSPVWPKGSASCCVGYVWGSLLACLAPASAHAALLTCIGRRCLQA